MAPEFVGGNRLTLLDSGREYFPALLQALAVAEHAIFLETYIYANDVIGRQVTDALCQAAQRGVAVHVTVDGFGARNFRVDFAPRLRAAGVQAIEYRPELGRFHLRRHRLRRLHRKLVVVDGQLAFVGGINVIDDFNAPAGEAPRYDYAVQVEGPVVAQIDARVRHMWEIVTWAAFRRRFRVSRLGDKPAAAGNQAATFLIRDNIRHRNDILNAYLAAIHQAREEIVLANAYFLPGVRFARALQAAARRGVRITILLQGKTDHPLLRFATQALYDAGLREGLRIFEYERSFLHAKVAVIDGEWATVGSSNIDPFSLLLAKEANLVVRDAAFAGALRASLLAAMAGGATEMSADALARHGLLVRAVRWLSYGLVRALVGLTGYGQRHWGLDEEGAG